MHKEFIKSSQSVVLKFLRLALRVELHTAYSSMMILCDDTIIS